MQGRLKKVSNNENDLRTAEIECEFEDLPCVGECFIIFSKPLELKDGVRVVRTSIIQEIERTPRGFRFKTMNSVYELEMNIH